MLMVEVLGRGCQARVSEVSGMSRGTLIAGAKDLAEGPMLGERDRLGSRTARGARLLGGARVPW